MRVTVQGLMDRQGAVHITAPEKEKTLFTMDAAKAMKLMPKTTDSNSLKPPEISSLERRKKRGFDIQKIAEKREATGSFADFPRQSTTALPTCAARAAETLCAALRF
jgi:hypothetical protein